jgi:hypothetical protein
MPKSHRPYAPEFRRQMVDLEHQRRYRASSSRPPRRSGTGCDRPIAVKAADMTARPMPSVRS